MPRPDKLQRHSPEEKIQKAEKRLMANGLLIALCVAAIIGGYVMASFVSEWILGGG